MEFFNSAIEVLQTLVVALGAGLGVWGAINLLEGYGNDNPGSNAPDGKILKADVTVAKNYLSKEEMNYLERIVSLYLDYAELQAERKIPMSMEDWAKRLDGFLEFNGNELLTGPGKISAEQAKLHAETEYEKYRVIQDRLYESDFDRFLMLEQEVNHKDEV